MCMLTFFPGGTMPDVDALSNGAFINNDGHGYAIVAGDRLIVRHSMHAANLIERFTRDRKRNPSGPALFHSRWGTGGTIGKLNCHPFRVGRDRRTVLAHNGVLGPTMQPGQKDKRCDTRIAAEDFLPGNPFGSLTTQRARDRFARWLTPRNKVVILTVDRRYRSRSYVVNEAYGVWHSGVWYSNDDFRADPRWFAMESEVTVAGERCGTCLEIDAVETITGMCRVCGACADCCEPDGHCVCYSPGRLWSAKAADVQQERLW